MGQVPPSGPQSSQPTPPNTPAPKTSQWSGRTVSNTTGLSSWVRGLFNPVTPEYIIVPEDTEAAKSMLEVQNRFNLQRSQEALVDEFSEKYKMDKNEVEKLVTAGTQALFTIHPELESGQMPLNDSLFLELREAVWQGVVLAAVRADSTVLQRIGPDMPERLVRIILAEKALDTPAARAERLAGLQKEVLQRVLTTISHSKERSIEEVRDIRILAEITQKIITQDPDETDDFNKYVEALPEKYLQVAARNMMAERLQKVGTLPSTAMGFDPKHVLKQKELFDAVRAAQVAPPDCLKLKASTLIKIANNTTALNEFQANVGQALRGLSETRQHALIQELVDHYKAECSSIQNQEIEQQILKIIDDTAKQMAPLTDYDTVNIYKSMDLNDVCKELRSGEIERRLQGETDLTQREILVIISHTLSNLKAPPRNARHYMIVLSKLSLKAHGQKTQECFQNEVEITSTL